MTDPIDQPAALRNRAVHLRRFGGLEVIEIAEVAMPEPHDDDVLVRVAAASVNPVDWKTAEGQYPPMGADKLPFDLGRDLAGTIARRGSRAPDTFDEGDRVFAFIGNERGAQSAYQVVKAAELVSIPAGIDDVTAAAVPLAAMTAWQGLFDHGGLREGQRVLVHGGAGGVGHLTVQLAAWKGATVYATCSARDLDYVRSLGAIPIDYAAERFEDVATDIDIVYDTQGGETQRRSFATLRQGGIVVTTLEPETDAAAAAGVRVSPRWHAAPDAAQLGMVADLVAAGTIRVAVARTFPLDEAREAYRFAQQEHPRGKVVLTVA